MFDENLIKKSEISDLVVYFEKEIRKSPNYQDTLENMFSTRLTAIEMAKCWLFISNYLNR